MSITCNIRTTDHPAAAPGDQDLGGHAEILFEDVAPSSLE
jgi:hypothetical protein